MGVDVVGLQPANQGGEYFHATYHGWCLLWPYTVKVCPDILTLRDGEEPISRAKAIAIGERLANLVRAGNTLADAEAHSLGYIADKFTSMYDEREGFRPESFVDGVREFAQFCITSGGFEIL
jgi:hypothetical protein